MVYQRTGQQRIYSKVEELARFCFELLFVECLQKLKTEMNSMVFEQNFCHERKQKFKV